MDIVLSGNKAFCKWLNLDLPRIQAQNNKGIGVQRLTTDLSRVCWQCHAIKNVGTYCDTWDIIIVEAYSRYTIILPQMSAMSQKDFEYILLKRWRNELTGILLNYQVITEQEMSLIDANFANIDFKFHWINNTDMSVSGHVSDAELWLRSENERNGAKSIDDKQAYSLGMHVNQLQKKINVNQKPKKYDKFYPFERFINDFMLRFSDREYMSPYSLEQQADFPNPYKYALSKAEMLKKNKANESSTLVSPIPSNVFSLEKARANKQKK